MKKSQKKYNIKKIQSVNLENDKVFNSWKLEKNKRERHGVEEDTHNKPSFKIELGNCEDKQDKDQKLKMKKVSTKGHHSFPFQLPNFFLVQ